eukprot:TRINITY_DN224_c0_g1_i1.p2 TRINITY_DN224_c0_g1~~TRINITY_DN224_c0_g1_i1.p2  ORF type:complete len:153 (-),score=66.42 TRINITY_DN224_c0_g1_i1:14-472(-)
MCIRDSYRTASNKIKLAKTPGGQLALQYRTKRGKGQVCGDTGAKLNGLPHLRSKAFKRLSKVKRTVSRPYGGSRSAGAVKTRIVRAFLLEELKELKKMKTVKDQKKKIKKKEKVAKKQSPYPHSLITQSYSCLLYTSPSPRDQRGSRMPSSA